MSLLRCFLVTSLLGTSVLLAADPALPPIFSSGMVLQRDRPILVWGTADDGIEVTVQLGEASAKGLATEGRWEVKLPAREASAAPLKMTVSFSDGSESVTLDDILVGEVWLCAGQSNMAQLVGKKPPRELTDMPQVRQFARSRGKGSSEDPQWKPAVGDNLADMSNTAIYFAEGLYKNLNVPVGIVLAAVSGTPIEEWAPREVLEDEPETKALIEKALNRENRKQMTAARAAMRKDPTIKMDPELEALLNLTNPGRLYTIHIAPTVPFPVRGVIWYQGEANSKNPSNAKSYGHYLSMLIAGLREAYQQPELPFYLVQLPSIEEKPKKGEDVRVYEIVREQQRLIVQKTPQTGLAVTMDIHEGLHPRSKNIVGDRLAGLALNEVYGKKSDQAYAGPLPTGVEFQGPKAVCSFEHAEGGLELKETTNDLFEIAGADGNFHPATAKVEGTQLVVQSDDVAKAQAVRYAYKPSVEKVSLYGATGIPASPFSLP